MNNFQNALKEGKFVITTEIGPPKGVSLDSVFEDLEHVRGRVDAVNVTDHVDISSERIHELNKSVELAARCLCITRPVVGKESETSRMVIFISVILH